MADTHWLLDLTVDTQIVRLAERALDVVCDDGTILHYAEGVEVEPVTEAISLLSASVSSPEAGLTLYLDTVTPLTLLRASGSLARWTEGTTWENRRRLIVGRFQGPEQGQANEGIRTTLAQDSWLDPEPLIPASQVVSTTTWSTASTLVDASSDTPYPIIIGHPGRTGTAEGESVPAVVTLRIDATLGQPGAIAPNWDGVAYQLAGHHISATRCRLSTETVVSGHLFHVINTFDDVGQPVAVAPWFYSSDRDPVVLAYDAAGAYSFFDGVSEYGVGADAINDSYNVDDAQPAIYASFEDPTDLTSGGLQRHGRLVRSAGDVLDWALGVSGVFVDSLRMAEAQAALQAYQIDAVIAVRCSPWDWVTQVLLPLLPCSVAAGPDGLYVVPLFLDAGEADCEARIDTSRPDVTRAGPISWDTSKLVRTVTVREKYNVRTNQYTSQVVYGSRAAAAADPTASTRIHATLTAADTFDLPGQDLIVSSAAIYETATAGLVGSTLARIYGLPIGSVPFSVPEDDPVFRRLRRGSVVWVADTDTDLDRVAHVYSIVTAGDGSLLVSLWLFLDPARDSLQ